MLTEKEKHGIAELLGRMSTNDLDSLAQTVTLRLVKPDSSSEAIASIILHTERASDLLKRRKVKKEFLFKYLHDKRVEGVEATSEKSVMIKHVLQLWESPELTTLTLSASSTSLVSAAAGALGDEESLPEAPAPSRNTSYSSLCSLDLYNNHSANHQHPPNLAILLNRSQSASSSNLQITQDDSQSMLKRSESNVSFMDEGNDGMMATNTPSAFQNNPLGMSSFPALRGTQSLTPETCSLNMLNGTVSPNITSAEAQSMADTFVKWYYELLNSHSAEFRPDHFFPDASARICLQSHNRSQPPQLIQVHNNGTEVCSALIEIVIKYKLTYNPNLCRDGVSGAIDPHGLVIVNACGTLHSANTCCGTFQQQFGLVRDPAEKNNWKIKFTNVNLLSKAQEEVQGAIEGQQQQQQMTSAMALS